MAVKTKAALAAAAELSEISQKLNKLTSAREEALRQIALQYDAEIERAKKEQSEATETVLEYVQANEANIFPTGKKTAKWEGLTISYRQGSPSLAIVDPETTDWDKVLAYALKHAPEYVATKQEISKSKILADADKLSKILPKLGIRVQSTVSWTVKPC